MRCPSLSTTASNRTTSSAPQEPGPVIGASGCIKTKSGVSRCWQAESWAGVVGAGASATGAGWRGGCRPVLGASRDKSVAARLSRISAVARAAIVARADRRVRIPRHAIKGLDLLLPPIMAMSVLGGRAPCCVGVRPGGVARLKSLRGRARSSGPSDAGNHRRCKSRLERHHPYAGLA